MVREQNRIKHGYVGWQKEVLRGWYTGVVCAVILRGYQRRQSPLSVVSKLWTAQDTRSRRGKR